MAAAAAAGRREEIDAPSLPEETRLLDHGREETGGETVETVDVKPEELGEGSLFSSSPSLSLSLLRKDSLPVLAAAAAALLLLVLIVLLRRAVLPTREVLRPLSADFGLAAAISGTLLLRRMVPPGAFPLLPPPLTGLIGSVCWTIVDMLNRKDARLESLRRTDG